MNNTQQIPLPPGLARLIDHQMERARSLQREADVLRSEVTAAIDEHCRLSGLDPSKVQYDPNAQMLLISADQPSHQDPSDDRNQHSPESPGADELLP